jgi:hypothetical protein
MRTAVGRRDDGVKNRPRAARFVRGDIERGSDRGKIAHGVFEHGLIVLARPDDTQRGECFDAPDRTKEIAVKTDPP